MIDGLSQVAFASAEALLVCAGTLFLLLRTGLAQRVLDRPNSRSLHKQPIPRVGGLAILVAVIVTAATAGEFEARSYLLLPVLAVSLVDDMRGLSIAPRFAIHFSVAIWAVAAFWPLSDGGLLWAAVIGVLAVFGVVWSTNLYNFMDGSDGLAGGMTVFGFLFLALGAYRGGETGLAAYCLSFAAASVAFLCVNFHPARIFMGDSGSAPIGFAAAAVAVEGVAKGLWALWYPVLVFAPFVFDATVTLLRRMLRRERFWQAHRDHYYQRLIRMGWGHRRTALTYYGLMLISGLAAYKALPLAMPGPLFVVVIALLVSAGLMIVVDRWWSASERAKEGKSS